MLRIMRADVFLAEAGLVSDDGGETLYLSATSAEELARGYEGQEIVNEDHGLSTFIGRIENVRQLNDGSWRGDLVTDSQAAIENLKNGYGTSGGYHYSRGPGGEYNGVRYDWEILKPEPYELSIVMFPRYEKARNVHINSLRRMTDVVRKAMFNRERKKDNASEPDPAFVERVAAAMELLAQRQKKTDTTGNADKSGDLKLYLRNPEGGETELTLEELLSRPEIPGIMAEIKKKEKKEDEPEKPEDKDPPKPTIDELLSRKTDSAHQDGDDGYNEDPGKMYDARLEARKKWLDGARKK